MAQERYDGEASENAEMLRMLRLSLRTRKISEPNVDLNRFGAAKALEIEKYLHKRQVELQKSGITPAIKIELQAR